jgi:EmrB/QacA subfamily drug resistance transporter
VARARAVRETKEAAVERKWWTLIAVSVAIFMLLLDITVVNVALPDIQRSQHSSFRDLQWVVNAYALTLAAFLLTAGAFADLFGRRRVFVIGLVVFTVSSAACGLSGSPLALNLARAVQGTGGAMMFATSLALIAQAFHGRERGIAFGVYGGVIGAAVAVGPVVGGVITSGIGWEWIFFVNVPIGIGAVALTLSQVSESRDPNATGVDWLGLLTWSGSLFLLVFALVQGNEKGWGSPRIVTYLVTSAVLLVLFVFVERRQRRPMLDLTLFSRPAFAGASLVALTLSSSMFAMFLYLTLYIQDVLGYSPLQAGLRFLPITLLSFFVAPLSGRLSVRVPVRLLLGAGMLLVSGGLFAMTAITPSSGWTTLIPGFLLAGAGIGMVNPPLASTAVGVVHYTRSGMASGINNTFRQVGIATGIAGLGAVFQHQVTSNTTAALAEAPSGAGALGALHGKLGSALVSGEIRQLARSLRPSARGALEHAYRVGFVESLTTILLIAVGIALCGALLAFVLVRSRDFVAAEAPADSREAAPVGVGAG